MRLLGKEAVTVEFLRKEMRKRGLCYQKTNKEELLLRLDEARRLEEEIWTRTSS